MVEFIARFKSKKSAEEVASEIHSDSNFKKLNVNVDDTEVVISGISAIDAVRINDMIKYKKSLVAVQF